MGGGGPWCSFVITSGGPATALVFIRAKTMVHGLWATLGTIERIDGVRQETKEVLMGVFPETIEPSMYVRGYEQ